MDPLKERDTFVNLLRMLIDGWRAQKECEFDIRGLSHAEREKRFMQFQVLIAKTNKFLREEFGDEE